MPIEQATNRGVENIARYYHHETVRVGGDIDDTLRNIRRGLMKACGRTTYRQRRVKTPSASTSESQGFEFCGAGAAIFHLTVSLYLSISGPQEACSQPHPSTHCHTRRWHACFRRPNVARSSMDSLEPYIVSMFASAFTTTR